RADDIAGIFIGSDSRRRQRKVNHGGAADAHLQIASNGASGHSGFGYGGNLASRSDPGRLSDIDRKRVRGARAKGRERIVTGVNTLIGDNRDTNFLANLDEPIEIAWRHGLFGEIDAGIPEPVQHTHRSTHTPGSVRIHAEANAGTDGVPHSADARYVLLRIDPDL